LGSFVLKRSKMYFQGFKPIIPDHPKVLILGTMPSVQSTADGFYYAHPRNAFWPILSSYFGSDAGSKEAKVQLCLDHNLFIWDVLAACERKGSSDGHISQPISNDFESVFIQFPHLKHILFNGQKAYQLFQSHVLRKQSLPSDIHLTTLPSTSPANARLTFENKRFFWQETLDEIF